MAGLHPDPRTALSPRCCVAVPAGCVESTMRTAYEKGYNVVTLTDCTATTTEEGQKAATTGTFGWFSLPMTADELKEMLAV